MKEISWTEFKSLKAMDVKTGQCLKVLADGEMMGYFVVNPIQNMKNEIEVRCTWIDKARGFGKE